MKSNPIKGALLSCVVIMLVACNAKKEEPVMVDKEQIKKEIQDKENEYAALYNSGEVKNIGYYADDAITFIKTERLW